MDHSSKEEESFGTNAINAVKDMLDVVLDLERYVVQEFEHAASRCSKESIPIVLVSIQLVARLIGEARGWQRSPSLTSTVLLVGGAASADVIDGTGGEAELVGGQPGD